MRLFLNIFIGCFFFGCAHSPEMSDSGPIDKDQAENIAIRAAEKGDWHVTKTSKVEQSKDGWNVFLVRIHVRYDAEYVKVIVSTDGKRAKVWPDSYVPTVNETIQRSTPKRWRY